VGVFGAPARALFHHRVADEVAFDEAAVGVLLRIALGVELGGVLQHGDHGAARQRLALLGGVGGRPAGVELRELLGVCAVHRGEGAVVKSGPGVGFWGRATLPPPARTGPTAASAATAPAMDAMVTEVRIVMVSPPWLSPRPLRSDAACVAGAAAGAGGYSKPATAVVTCW